MEVNDMETNTLYDAIFYRKSVRKFVMSPLTKEKLAALRDFAGTIHPLIPSIRTEFIALGADEVKNPLASHAPNYVAICSEKKDGYLMNAGFMLQQLDLYLSSIGLGSCWLGMAKPVKEAAKGQNGLDFVILLAIGEPAEPAHRASTAEFKRKALDEITTVEGAKELLEPVRLAPSGTNAQPWFVSGTPEQLTVSRKKPGLITPPIINRMSQINTGIALCHLWLAAEHFGKKASVGFESSPAPAGYEFMANVKIGGNS
jgi:nitroreductase